MTWLDLESLVNWGLLVILGHVHNRFHFFVCLFFFIGDGEENKEGLVGGDERGEGGGGLRKGITQ